MRFRVVPADRDTQDKPKPKRPYWPTLALRITPAFVDENSCYAFITKSEFKIRRLHRLLMGLATSGEIDRPFVALAFVLPPSIIPTSNRNLRNLCNLRIFHLRGLGLFAESADRVFKLLTSVPS